MTGYHFWAVELETTEPDGGEVAAIEAKQLVLHSRLQRTPTVGLTKPDTEPEVLRKTTPKRAGGRASSRVIRTETVRYQSFTSRSMCVSHDRFTLSTDLVRGVA